MIVPEVEQILRRRSILCIIKDLSNDALINSKLETADVALILLSLLFKDKIGSYNKGIIQK